MINITENEKKNVRTIEDNMNPSLYNKEYKCIICEKWHWNVDVIVTLNNNYICNNCQDEIKMNEIKMKNN